jgi:branched-chain amino acid transport system substrate-binding protein
MRSGMFHWLAGAAVAIAMSALPASAQKKYDPGASDTEIKIGQTVPFSGPASAYAGIGKTQAAYFKMINEQGGINGRKLNLIQYDDAYSPPKAVEQVRKLVEGDEVLFTFQIIGTPSNTAVRNISTPRRCRSSSPRRGPRNSPIPRTSPGPWASIPTTSPKGASMGSTF